MRTTKAQNRWANPYTCLLIGCVTLILSTPAGAFAQPFSRIVVFGDSLSDPGNAFALLGSTSTAPDYSLDPYYLPGAPYARGGQRFQNGATWVEQLARSLGLAGSVRPAFQGANEGAFNFAVGGARARDDGRSLSLPVQVQEFLQRSSGAARSDALYVIAIGGNDVRDGLVAYSQGQDGSQIVGAAIASIANSVATLHAAGARTFVIWNAPDLGRTPAVRLAGPAAAVVATLVSQQFNLHLDAALGGVSSLLDGARLVTFDAFGLITDIVANPPAYGMIDVSSPCVTPDLAPFVCENPDAFLFWDGIHPTKATHAIIAGIAALLIQ